MSAIGIASSVMSLISSFSSGSSTASSGTGSAQSGDFASSLALRMASMKAQSINPLLGGTARSGGLDEAFSLPGMTGNASRTSAAGRNLSLFDPESAFRMMSDINNREVNYKAQFAELSEMKEDVSEMRAAGLALGNVGSQASNDAIKERLQSFVSKYNEWVSRFEGTVQDGGVLDGTQAAEVSLYELRQSIENRFNGAMHGMHGLRDLGIDIDPQTHLASLDTGKLDSVLAQRKDGVIAAINDFSANFAKSAELLVSDNNFIPNRLNNLDRAIDFIGDNRASLQAEFGTGDAARPNAQVARALAAYNQMFKA